MSKKSIVKQYGRLEDRNDHNKAALLLVSLFGTTEEIETVDAIIARCEESEDGISPEDYKTRTELTLKYTPMLNRTMYTVKENQYLPNGIGRPASTYFYIVNSDGDIYHKDGKCRANGLKDISKYAYFDKELADGICTELNSQQV